MPDIPPTFGKRKPKQRSGGSTHARDTSSAYKRQRLSIFAAEPLCRYCGAQGRITAATILDHIIALGLGGTNDPSNLAPACRDCNSDKAVAEARYLTRGYDIASVRYDDELSAWFRLALVSSQDAQPRPR